jgi:hypothetical protein
VGTNRAVQHDYGVDLHLLLSSLGVNSCKTYKGYNFDGWKHPLRLSQNHIASAMLSLRCISFLAVISVAVAQIVKSSVTSPDTSLRVGDLGGNATSPLQYGIMFEV